MKTTHLKHALLISLFAGMVALAGCEEKGPMENAGENIDNALDTAGDAVEDAAVDATN